MAQIKDIYVYMDWQESDSPIQMGVLHSEVLRGKEVFSFENNTDWLTYKQFRALDPDLAKFYYWQKKLRESKLPAQNFVPIVLDSRPPDSVLPCASNVGGPHSVVPSAEYEILYPCGTTLRIRGTVSTELLKTLIQLTC